MLCAVGFDLDDTIAVAAVDRETLLERAARRAGVDLAFDRADYLAAHREHSGTGSRRPVFESLVDEDAARLTRAYREVVGEALTPVADLATVLETLRSRYRVGLLTDGPIETQRDKLERLTLTDAFDGVVITGALDAPKPDPAGFRALADALCVEPAGVVYVGNDPERDVAGAAAVGMTPIQVRYDGGPDRHPAAAATIRRDDLASLPRLLATRFADEPTDP